MARAARDAARPSLVDASMPVSIRDAKSSPADRAWIERVYSEYLVDLADGRTGVFPALLVTGQRPRELLAPWYRDDNSAPFVIVRAGQAAGFALVQGVPARAAPVANIRLTEFFIQKPLRGLGIGREAATLLFNRYAGDWLVTTPTQQRGAVEFWKKVISRHTGGRFREQRDGGEVRYSFTTRRAAQETVDGGPG